MDTNIAYRYWKLSNIHIYNSDYIFAYVILGSVSSF